MDDRRRGAIHRRPRDAGGLSHWNPFAPGGITARRSLSPDRTTPYRDDMYAESDNLMDAPPAGRTATAQAAAPLGADEFQGLLVEVLPSAFGYALRLTRNRADAEDLVQDTAL